MKIVHYSNKHRADDNRIFELEAMYAVNAGYEVVTYGINGKDELTYGIRSKCSARTTKQALHICKSENADIYTFHDPGMLFCAVLLKLSKKTVIFDAHENYEEKVKTRIQYALPQLAFARKIFAKLFWLYEKCCVSLLSGKIVADRTVLKKYGKNTVLLPNVPGRVFFENPPTRKRDDNMFRMIYVGTLTQDRGILQTIEAIRICKHKNVEFHIIGETRDERLAAAIKSAPNTVWHGRVPWRELKQHLVNADLGTVLLQPTEAFIYCPGENIVKLWEYMSFALPVLISNFAGIIRLNDELNFGLCVKSDDATAIANGIDWMIEHQDERREMGERGKKAVVDKYNAEMQIKSLLELYSKISMKKR